MNIRATVIIICCASVLFFSENAFSDSVVIKATTQIAPAAAFEVIENSNDPSFSAIATADAGALAFAQVDAMDGTVKVRAKADGVATSFARGDHDYRFTTSSAMTIREGTINFLVSSSHSIGTSPTDCILNICEASVSYLALLQGSINLGTLSSFTTFAQLRDSVIGRWNADLTPKPISYTNSPAFLNGGDVALKNVTASNYYATLVLPEITLSAGDELLIRTAFQVQSSSFAPGLNANADATLTATLAFTDIPEGLELIDSTSGLTIDDLSWATPVPLPGAVWLCLVPLVSIMRRNPRHRVPH